MTTQREGKRLRKVERAKKAARILELYVAGLTYDAIAKQVGLKSKSRICEIVARELLLIPKRNADEARALVLARNQDVVRASQAKVRKGDMNAAGVLLRANQELRDLFGLDAPKKQELTGANGGPLEVVSEAGERLRGFLDGLAAKQSTRALAPGDSADTE